MNNVYCLGARDGSTNSKVPRCLDLDTVCARGRSRFPKSRKREASCVVSFFCKPALALNPKRNTNIKALVKRFILLTIVPLAFAAFTLAQEAPPSGQIFSSDLIAWSGMQRLQAPEENSGRQQASDSSTQTSSPSTQNPSTQTPSPGQDASTQKQAPTASIFTGTVTKEADGFVLKVSETTTYKLDSKQQIEQYEGQRVRVTGTLESGMNIIHVDRIEPLS